MECRLWGTKRNAGLHEASSTEGADWETAQIKIVESAPTTDLC
jgi:hypothetical protein